MKETPLEKKKKKDAFGSYRFPSFGLFPKTEDVSGGDSTYISHLSTLSLRVVFEFFFLRFIVGNLTILTNPFP